MDIKRCAPWAAILLVVALPSPDVQADPLHPITGDAYWHHESNFVFPGTLAGFTRIGAPQEVDGSTTINAHYGGNGTERWLVVTLDLFPKADGAADFTGATSIGTVDLGPTRGTARRAIFKGTGNEVIYALEHGGWRLMARARLLEDHDATRVEDLLRALPLERLGELDTRCPNAGCGT